MTVPRAGARAGVSGLSGLPPPCGPAGFYPGSILETVTSRERVRPRVRFVRFALRKLTPGLARARVLVAKTLTGPAAAGPAFSIRGLF
jgi:hypothetical protein